MTKMPMLKLSDDGGMWQREGETGRRSEKSKEGERDDTSQLAPEERARSGDEAGYHQEATTGQQRDYLSTSPPPPLSPLRRHDPPAASGPPP
jgi:hypothetical protein